MFFCKVCWVGVRGVGNFFFGCNVFGFGCFFFGKSFVF
jgi:hypothetical protein